MQENNQCSSEQRTKIHLPSKEKQHYADVRQNASQPKACK
jgi:hypothetical protein